MDKIFIIGNIISAIAITVAFTVEMSTSVQFYILGPAVSFPVMSCILLIIYGIYKLINR